MFKLHIEDMTCGNCASKVAGAIRDADGAATVQVDMRERLVSVNTILPLQELCDTLADVGYRAVPRA
ncbi:MAG: Heavy-metal-associated domain [Pseudoduganella sp.]|jgi:copper chaperone|nr:Heavy-metal-associated domain [Pseudoduganella sp.]